MPMQFRCGSCQQLLGIAKRKAGSVVSCPTCAAKTLVPHTGGEAVQAPVRRNPTQPMSVFDRMDVDKLLQKPTRPQLVEEDSAVAVAPPPVRRKMVFTPEPRLPEPRLPAPLPDPLLEETPVPVKAEVEEEHRVMPRLDSKEAEPISDEPFALSPVPTLTPSRKSHQSWNLPIVLLIGAVFVAGAFLVGHWVGVNRPLF
jgi:hypothetical protein